MDFKRIYSKLDGHTGLVFIILAAILLEIISAFQYYYTRGIVERNLERHVLMLLSVSAQRMDGIMRGAETIVLSQVWHAQQHLDEPEYMETLVYNLVKNEGDKIVGGAICFKPNYYADKGYWYEPYAHQIDDSITINQIGSAQHDYTKKEFYKICIKGDTVKWNTPYFDADGAQNIVTTFGVPIRDEQGEPVATLIVDMTTEWISEMVNSIHLHPSSFTLILSTQGQLIALPEAELCDTKLAEKIAAMINDSTVEKEKRVNGHVTCFEFYDEEKGRAGHVYYVRKKYEPHWLMVKVCYDDEIFGELTDMHKITLGLSLIGLLVLGLIIHRFAHNGRKLQKSLMKQERIEGELQIARRLQAQMQPLENKMVRSDISLHGILKPAREVGGDLYDFFIRDEKLFFCIGDVSGKGVPAAFIMAMTQTLFHNMALHSSNPAHIMDRINASACRNNESNMFATLFVGVLDLPTGLLRYCNAGHEIPFVIGAATTKGDVTKKHVDDSMGYIQHLDVKANLPIGLFSDFAYEKQETIIAPGETLFLYTDGLTEARNERQELLGKKHAMQLVADCRDMMPKQIIEAVVAHVERYAANTEQSDDLTLLAIRYTPQEEQHLLDEELRLDNDVKEVAKLSTFIKDVLARLDIAKPLASKLRLAVEEAVVNSMEYAYPADSRGEINLRVTFDGKKLRFVISDHGFPFNPTEASTADTTLSAEERPIGGLGIMLIRELMDSINYERISGKEGTGEKAKNVLTLIKNINH